MEKAHLNQEELLKNANYYEYSTSSDPLGAGLISQVPYHVFPHTLHEEGPTAVWSYHRFNDSFRDVAERLAYRGIVVSYETIRTWCNKFGRHFSDVIKKRPYKPSDKMAFG